MKGGRGHWAVYNTSPQSFIVFLFVGLTTLVTFVEIQNVSKLFERGKFVHYHVHEFIGNCLIPLDPWVYCSAKIMPLTDMTIFIWVHMVDIAIAIWQNEKE